MSQVISTVKYISEIEVLDPDTNALIDVTIYKDEVSGAMFGIDTSWPHNHCCSPYDRNVRIKFQEDAD